MALFDEEDSADLKKHLLSILEKICDADPNILAEYVMVLLQHDKTKDEIYKICINDLRDFLGDKTENFVGDLFDSLKYKSYSKISNRYQSSPKNEPQKRKYDRYSSKSPRYERSKRDYSQTGNRDRKSIYENSYDDYDNRRNKKKNSYKNEYNSKNDSRSTDYSGRNLDVNYNYSNRNNEDSGSDFDLKKRYNSRNQNSNRTAINNDFSTNREYSSGNSSRRNSVSDQPINSPNNLDQTQNDEPYDPEDAVINHENPNNETDDSFKSQEKMTGFRPPIMLPGMIPVPNMYPINMNMPMHLRVGMGMGLPINPGIGVIRPVNHPYNGNAMRPIPQIPNMIHNNSSIMGYNALQNKNLKKNIKTNGFRPQYHQHSQNITDPNKSDNNASIHQNIDDIKFVPDTQFVIENIPVEHLNRFSIDNYFSQFGQLINVQVDIDSKSALVIFSNSESGLRAYRSPNAILGNRFVSIRKRKRSQAEQNKPQNIQQDVQTDEEIRNRYLEKQKSIAELNDKKTKLVDMYMEQQKMLMNKLIDPVSASKLTKPAIEEIKTSIKKIQQLVKQVLSDTIADPNETVRPSAEPKNSIKKNLSDSNNNGLSKVESGSDSFNNSEKPYMQAPTKPSTYNKKAMKLDFRTKTLILENLPADTVTESLKAELSDFGTISLFEYDSNNRSAEITYSQRWEAEELFKKAPLKSGFDQVSITWKNTTDTIKPEIDTPLSSGPNLNDFNDPDDSILSSAFNTGEDTTDIDNLGYDGFSYHDSVSNIDGEKSWNM
ncbi:putative RNA-binding protein [Smittium culicis]|uniref:Putative RNA-binding protein n=1 Tax=Smittium culicis TaxID=133412 RepID=A0A1R1XQ86_9FUNG|nr:putative RNA-binding protein [Smittium culicis]